MNIVFNTQDLILGLTGGLIIGLSVTIMLLFKGRVTGISGITYRFVTMEKGEWPWRGFFLFGLITGGIVMGQLDPESMNNTVTRSFEQLVLAGFLVGFGTLLGNGCTSGHGVCGISRLSVRSIIATLAFMLTGIITTYIFRVFVTGA